MKRFLKILGIILFSFVAFIGLISMIAGDLLLGFFVLAVGVGVILLLTRKPPEERAAQQPAKKRPKALGAVLVIFGSVVFLFGLLMQLGSSGGETGEIKSTVLSKGKPEVVSSSGAAAGSSGAKVGDNFGPGDTVRLDGVLITFHGITETIGDGLFKPDDNKIFVVAEFTVENNSEKQINISSVFGSAAYCDNYLVQESMAAELGDPQHRSNLTGSLDSGRKLRGIIGYELPSQWQLLEIKLQTDWWKGSQSGTVVFVAEAA